ncbi:MAG: ABC transporter permease subunit [Planctomycetales bacterium]
MSESLHKFTMDNPELAFAIVNGLILFSPLIIWLGLGSIFGRSPTWNIMMATAKESVRQPVYFFMLFVVILLNLLNTFIPFFTLGDDIKMLKDGGLATILISGLLLAVWTASMSIAEEIEGKTAMTLLSKPINRRQFILGKYLGILYGVLLLYVPVILAFLWCVFYKVFYDSRESSGDATVQLAVESTLQLLPGLILMFMEVMVVAAISVAVSTRLPMVVNVVICLAIFVIGHLTPSLVHAGVFKFELVEFMARLIATVLPVLEVFNISSAISTGSEVPLNYVGWAGVYCLTYSAIAIFVAFILFEDRDLA